MLRRLTKFLEICAALTLGIFFACTWWWFLLCSAVQFGSPYLLLLMLGSFLIFCAAVIIHEGGHLLAALALGLRVILFRVGRVGIIRTAKGFQLRSFNPADRIGGAIVALPRGGGFSPSRMGLLIAAGPLTNLLSACLCFWGVYALNDTVAFPYAIRLGSIEVRVTAWNRMLIPVTHVAAWLSVAWLINMLLFLASLIPSRRKGLSSDASLLLDLLWNRPLKDIRWLLTILLGALLDGIRPRDWNATYVDAMLAARTGTPKDMEANRYGYYYARDTGQIDLAGQLIDLAVGQREANPVALHAAILLEAAYFEGRYRHNAAVAREWLQQAQGGQVEQQTRLRAEAAVLWAEERIAEAAAKAREGLAVLPQSADPGGAIAEGDWLNDILMNCQKDEAQLKT